jgi:hypothetical protein
MVCISTQLVNCFPSRKKELYFTCVLLPLYCTLSVTSFPLPPFPMYSIYRQSVTVGGGRGGVEMYCMDHILSFTLCFWPDSEPTKLLHPSQTKVTSKDDIKGFVSLKFLRLCFDVKRKEGGGRGRTGTVHGSERHTTSTETHSTLKSNFCDSRGTIM